MQKPLLWLWVLIMTPIVCSSQDPATFLFSQHGSLFNPALTGTNGSQSISLAYRQQWLQTNDLGYYTAVLNYDESMPCSVLDIGLSALWDQEGAGLLTTYELTPRVSVNLPLLVSTSHQINLRLGGAMSFGRQRIQFDRLVFSDQLHPKYGNIFPTTFAAPDDDAAGSYFQPGAGWLLQMVFNKMNRNALVINAGMSFHNAYALGNNAASGYGKSVLGLLTPQTPKVSAHFDFEIVPGSSLGHFVSIKPVILYERQQGLYYLQYGLDFGLNNIVRIGGYVHQQRFFTPENSTNWFSISSVFKPYVGHERVDFYFTYSFNISGLRNTVSPLLEFGLKKHFRSSFTCRLMDKADGYKLTKQKCSLFGISPAKRKIYENVWYKD